MSRTHVLRRGASAGELYAVSGSGHDLPLRAVTPVCATCGAWFPDAAEPPDACPICADDRQWVPGDGQRWTTPDGILEGRSTDVREHEEGLTGIGIRPVRVSDKRVDAARRDVGDAVLLDMIPAVADEAVGAVSRWKRGGARAIAISHPHYYGAASAWSEALGGVPVLLHAADAEWVTRPDAAIEHWEGDVRELPGGVNLLRLGGHFPGATVLHWRDGADGQGALLSGDVVMAVPDHNVSFMWSYPNLVPLPAREVERIGAALEPWPFERIYGAWWDRVVPAGAKDAVRRSVMRYTAALRGELPL